MTSDERVRASLLEKLTQLLGSEEAAALMESMPPFEWSHLATKTDLALLATKEEIAKLATKEEIAKLATKEELVELRSELRREISASEERTELRREAMEYRLQATIVQTGSDLNSTMHELIRDTYLRLVGVLVPAMLAGVGLAFTAAKLA